MEGHFKILKYNFSIPDFFYLHNLIGGYIIWLCFISFTWNLPSFTIPFHPLFYSLCIWNSIFLSTSNQYFFTSKLWRYTFSTFHYWLFSWKYIRLFWISAPCNLPFLKNEYIFFLIRKQTFKTKFQIIHMLYTHYLLFLVRSLALHLLSLCLSVLLHTLHNHGVPPRLWSSHINLLSPCCFLSVTFALLL